MRPIPDRVRESLFGLLRGHLEGAVVFDGFAGSGAIGLEAISRGAARCIFVERDRYALALLRENIRLLGVEPRAEVVAGDVLGAGALARCPRPVNLVFLDPPYPLVREPDGWGRVRGQAAKLIERLSPDGFAVIRTPHPHVHAQASGEPAPAPTRARKGRTRRERPARDITEVVFSIDDEPVDESGLEELGREGVAAEKPRYVDADMAIAGAIGPETHEYGSTAVHLYMRKS